MRNNVKTNSLPRRCNLLSVTAERWSGGEYVAFVDDDGHIMTRCIVEHGNSRHLLQPPGVDVQLIKERLARQYRRGSLRI